MQQIFSDTKGEPLVTSELIEYLREKFPLEAFKDVSGERELYIYQGAQNVIDELQVVYDRQNDRIEE